MVLSLVTLQVSLVRMTLVLKVLFSFLSLFTEAKRIVKTFSYVPEIYGNTYSFASKSTRVKILTPQRTQILACLWYLASSGWLWWVPAGIAKDMYLSSSQAGAPASVLVPRVHPDVCQEWFRDKLWKQNKGIENWSLYCIPMHRPQSDGIWPSRTPFCDMAMEAYVWAAKPTAWEK